MNILHLLSLLTLAATPPVVSGDLDGDGQEETVTWQGGALVATRGQTVLDQIKLSAPTLSRLAMVRAGELTVVHGTGPLADGRRQSEIVLRMVDGRLQIIFDGPTGPQGDGEREVHLTVNTSGMLRYQTAAGIERCDGENRLFPELYDAKAGRFRPVTLAAPTGTHLRATRLVPPFAAASPSGLFRFIAASSQLGDERRADRLASPSALDDGRLDTTWFEGAAGAGRGVWMTARARAPEQEVVGIKLIPAAGNRLRRMALLVGADERFDFELPEWPSGVALWLPLPAPIKTSCVSLVLAEADEGGANQVGLSEAEIFTKLDQQGGLRALAKEVARNAPGASSLAQILAASGAKGLQAVSEALPEAQGAGRQLLLGSLAASGAPTAAPILVNALDHADEKTRALLREGLTRDLLGKAAVPILMNFAATSAHSVKARVDAIIIIAAHRDASLTRQLVQLALAGKLGSEAEVADAILTATTAGDSGELLALVAQDLIKTPNDSVNDVRLLAVLAPRLTRGNAALELTAPAITQVWSTAPTGDAGFELRFRILRAIRALALPSLGKIVNEAATSNDEALRAAALDAAAALGISSEALLMRGASDSNPRVRLAALTGLAAINAPSASAVLARALREDSWPMVRLESTALLENRCEGENATALEEAATRDRLNIRQAALKALAHCQPARARVLANRFLDDDAAPMPLREQSAMLADEKTLLRAAADLPFPTVRAAAIAALANFCSEPAKLARRAAVNDEEPVVQAAAQRPTRCPEPTK